MSQIFTFLAQELPSLPSSTVDQLNSYARYLIWVPTLLFLGIILTRFFRGVRRGLRKTIILSINSLIALVITVSIFWFVFRSSSFDTSVVSNTNNFLGQNYLQNQLNVDPGNKSLSSILSYYISDQMVKQGYNATLNGTQILAYAIAWAMVFVRLVGVILTVVIYFLLKILFYIFYLIFFREGRRKKRIKRLAASDDNFIQYKPHRLLGGLLGAFRGFVWGVIVLSFVGSFVYIFTQGTYKQNDDTNISNDTFGDPFSSTDYIYDIFNSYGTTGVGPLLEGVKDNYGVPYYLYIADSLTSTNVCEFIGDGQVIPEYSQNAVLHFRDVLGPFAYIGLKSAATMRKYFDPEIYNALDDENKTEYLINAMGNEDFQKEINTFIDEIPVSYYWNGFVKETISTLVTISDNLETTNLKQTGIDPGQNYLQMLFTGEDAIKPSYFDLSSTTSSVSSDNDIKVILKVAFNAFGMFPAISTVSSDASLDTKIVALNSSVDQIESLLSSIDELTIFKDASIKENINLALAKLLTPVMDNMDGTFDIESLKTYIKSGDVDFVGEISNLKDVIPPVLRLGLASTKVQIENSENEQIKKFFGVFSEPDYVISDGITVGNCLDSVSTIIANSKLLSVSLNVKGIENMLNETLGANSMFTTKTPINLPEIRWNNETLSDGTLSYGDTKKFFNAAIALVSNVDETAFDNFMDADTTQAERLQAVQAILEPLTKEVDGARPIDKIVESRFLHNMLSDILMNMSFDLNNMQIKPYINKITMCEAEPMSLDTTLTDEKLIIKANEFNKVFTSIDVATKLLIPAPGDEDADLITILLNNISSSGNISDTLDDLLSSELVSGTLSNIVCSTLNSVDTTSFNFAIPTDFDILDDTSATYTQNMANWIGSDTKTGELKNILLAAATSGALDLVTADSTTDTSVSAVELIKKLDDTKVKNIFDSKLMNILVTGMLTDDKLFESAGDLSLIVPDDALINPSVVTNRRMLVGDKSSNDYPQLKVLDAQQLIAAIREIVSVKTETDPSGSEVKKIELNYNLIFEDSASPTYSGYRTNVLEKSKVLVASVINMLTTMATTNDTFKQYLVIPSDYTATDLKTNYDNSKWIKPDSDDSKDFEFERLIEGFSKLGLVFSTNGTNSFSFGDSPTGDMQTDMLNQVLNLTSDNIGTMFKSELLNISMTNLFQSDSLLGETSTFQILIPDSSLVEKVSDDDPNTLISSEYDRLTTNSVVALIDGIKPLLVDDAGAIIKNAEGQISPDINKIFNDDTYRNTMLNSDVLSATVINMLITMSEEDNSFIALPEEYGNKDLLKTDYLNSIWKTSGELKSMLDATSAIGLTISDGTNFSYDEDNLFTNINNSSDVIFGNTENNIAGSKVLSATIGKLLLDNVGSISSVVVPESVVVVSGKNRYVSAEELKTLISIISSPNTPGADYTQGDPLGLGVSGMSQLTDSENGVLSSANLLSTITSTNTLIKDHLTKSKILYASISKTIYDNENDSAGNRLIFIPDNVKTVESFTVNEVPYNFIDKDELQNVILALTKPQNDPNPGLGVTSLDNISDSLDVNSLLSNIDVILSILKSKIIDATASYQVYDKLSTITVANMKLIVPTNLDLGNDTNIENNMSLWLTSYDQSGNVASKGETYKLLESIKELGIVSSITSGDSFDPGVLFEKDETTGNYKDMNKVLQSDVLHASIIATLINLASAGNTLDGLIIIPADMQLTDIQIKDGFKTSPWVLDNDIETLDLINGIRELGFDFDNPSASLNADTVDTLAAPSETDPTKEKIDILLKSRIMQQTVSKQLIDSTQIIVPTEALVNASLIRADEITKLVNSVSLVKVSTGEEFGISNITALNSFSDGTTRNIDRVLDSYIMWATLSSEIEKQNKTNGGSLNLESIEYVSGDNTTPSSETIYMSKTSLKRLIDAIQALGISSFDNIGPAIINTLTEKIPLEDQNTYGEAHSVWDRVSIIVDSAMISDTLSDTLKTISLINDNILPAACRDSDLSKPLEPNEIKYLIYSVDELDAVDDAGQMNVDVTTITTINHSSKNIEGQSKLDVIYGSLIIRNLLTNQLEQQSSIVILDQFKNSSDYDIIYKRDIEQFFDSLDLTSEHSIGLGLLTIATGDLTSLISSNTNRLKLLRSRIVEATLAKNVYTPLASFTMNPLLKLVDGTSRLDANYDNWMCGRDNNGEIISDKELMNILATLGSLGTNPNTAFTFEPDTIISNDAALSAALKSDILYTKISETLILTTTNPDRAYNNDLALAYEVALDTPKLLSKAEISNIVIGIKELGISSFDFNLGFGTDLLAASTNDPTKTKLEVIRNSWTLRYMLDKVITDTGEVANNSYIYDYTLPDKVETVNIYYLQYTQLEDLFSIIGTSDLGSLSLGLENGSINAYIDNDILRSRITSILLENKSVKFAKYIFDERSTDATLYATIQAGNSVDPSNGVLGFSAKEIKNLVSGAGSLGITNFNSLGTNSSTIQGLNITDVANIYETESSTNGSAILSYIINNTMEELMTKLYFNNTKLTSVSLDEYELSSETLTKGTMNIAHESNILALLYSLTNEDIIARLGAINLDIEAQDTTRSNIESTQSNANAAVGHPGQALAQSYVDSAWTLYNSVYVDENNKLSDVKASYDSLIGSIVSQIETTTTPDYNAEMQNLTVQTEDITKILFNTDGAQMDSIPKYLAASNAAIGIS